MAKRTYEETDMFDDDEDFVEMMDEQNNENGESTADDIENDILCIDMQLEEVGKKPFQYLIPIKQQMILIKQ